MRSIKFLAALSIMVLAGLAPALAQAATYHGAQNRRWVALTFDDGPSQYTAGVLRVLRQHHVSGSFFVVGQAASARPALVREEAREGIVGNHTWSHPYMNTLSPWQVHSEWERNQAYISQLTGYRPRFGRVPYGKSNDMVDGEAHRAGIKRIMMWGVDPEDWSRPGVNAIYQRVVSRVRPGTVVVMHDGGCDKPWRHIPKPCNRQQTVDALGHIITTLHHRGYHLVTLGQMFPRGK